MAGEAFYQPITKKLRLVSFTLSSYAEKTSYYTHLENSKNLANDKICETLKFIRMKLLSFKFLTRYHTVSTCYFDKFRLLTRWRISKNRISKVNNKKTKQSIKQNIADLKSQLILVVQFACFLYRAHFRNSKSSINLSHFWNCVKSSWSLQVLSKGIKRYLYKRYVKQCKLWEK